MLFHVGVFDSAPCKTNQYRNAERRRHGRRWRHGSRRPCTGLHRPDKVVAAGRDDGAHRGRAARVRRAGWSQNAPEVRRVADLRRSTHRGLQAAARRPAIGSRRRALSTISLAEHLGVLRTCFERLTEWDGDDIPARVLVFAGDLPLRDEPLPRFLDDAAFTKLLQAARADNDPFVRLSVEFLARTGLRKGEFLDVTIDSVVQIGAGCSLHVPIGKAAQRPLHPVASRSSKICSTTWLAGRPSSPAKPLPVHRARTTYQ